MASIERWDLNRRSESLEMTGVVLKEDRHGAYQNVCRRRCGVVDGTAFVVPALEATCERYRTRGENGEHFLSGPRGRS